jgi:hypothetical protein
VWFRLEIQQGVLGRRAQIWWVKCLQNNNGSKEDGVRVRGVRAFVAWAYSLACLDVRLCSRRCGGGMTKASGVPWDGVFVKGAQIRKRAIARAFGQRTCFAWSPSQSHVKNWRRYALIFLWLTKPPWGGRRRHHCENNNNKCQSTT